MKKICNHKNHVGDRELDVTEFYRMKKSTDGYRTYCKRCDIADAKQYAIVNAQRVKKQKHQYYINNKEKYSSPKQGKVREEYLNKKKQYYINNQATIVEYRQQYNKEHQESNREYRKRYYQQNKEKIKQYRQTNPVKHRGNRVGRRKIPKYCIPVWYNFERKTINELYNQCKLITKQTGIIHEVDHIVPINNKKVCGLHTLSNLRIITKEENGKKHNKLISLLCEH